MTTGAIIALFGCIYIVSVFCNYFLVRNNFKRACMSNKWTLGDRWICIFISLFSLFTTFIMLWELLLISIGPLFDRFKKIDWNREVKW